MKVILGLGNPGNEYALTRHNAGVLCVDSLSLSLGSPYGWRREKQAMIYKTSDIVLMKTAGVFMNESGKLIANGKLPTANLWVIHDDLDIKLGQFKVQKGIGPKVHNGVLSVEEALGSKDFWRIRIGIDNRTPDQSISGERYVLERFTGVEMSVLKGVINEITKTIIGK